MIRKKYFGILDKAGYIVTQLQEEADLIIFNTCCVRENAENRLFGNLGEVKKYALNGTLICVCGCMVEQKYIIDKIKKSYPYVRLIFGTNKIYKLPENLYNILNSDKDQFKIIDVENKDEIYEGIPTLHTYQKSAFVPIIYGCNNFCTYCIVPYVRGRERSRKPENIINEIKELVENGYIEVTLLGQNVNSYKGEGDIKNFAELLDVIANIEGLEKIRFISPHPKDFTEDVARVIRNNKNISRNFHYPMQSGSTKVLKEMNRKYTKEEYLEKAERLKKIVPDISFSTDIIVGFPGETEEDFEDTLDVVRKMNFEQIFMFIYSPRVGTIAAERKDQIPYNVSQKRFERLKNLYEEMVMKKNDEYIGKIVELIIEEETGKQIEKEVNREKICELDSLKGRTDSNKIVIIPKYDNWYIGENIKVKILENRKWYLKGKKEEGE